MGNQILVDKLKWFKTLSYDEQRDYNKKIDDEWSSLYDKYAEKCFQDKGTLEQEYKEYLMFKEASTYDYHDDFETGDGDEEQESYSYNEGHHQYCIERAERWEKDKKEMMDKIAKIKRSPFILFKIRDLRDLKWNLKQGQYNYNRVKKSQKYIALQEKYGDELYDMAESRKKIVFEKLSKIAKEVVAEEIEKHPMAICTKHTSEVYRYKHEGQEVSYTAYPLNDVINEYRKEALNTIKQEKENGMEM